jgi:hypothetical protein
MNRWEKFAEQKAEVLMSQPPVASEARLEENQDIRA